MNKQLLFWGIWVSFIAYAFFLAPPDRPDTASLILNLATGQWEGINPLVIALFNIMGIWPLIYSCLMFTDGSGQRISAWIFALASFAVGAFALLPYLALRNPSPTFSGDRNWVLGWLDSRLNGVAIAMLTMGLLIYGVVFGNWQDFVQQWQSSRFIHVMSLDFLLLCLLFPALLGDDMARRSLQDQRIFWIVSLLPLIGSAAYLALRPPIQNRDAESELEPSVKV